MAKGNSDFAGSVEPEIVTQKTSYDKLVQLISSDEKAYLLTESVEDQIEKMYQVRELFVQYGSRFRVLAELQKCGIPKTTAVRLVEFTPMLFAKSYKETIARDFHVDILFQNIMQTRRIALANNDVKGLASCDKNYATAIKDFTGSKELIDQDELNLPNVEIAFQHDWFPDLPYISSNEFTILKAQLSKRKEIKKKFQVLDIGHEEVTD